MARLDPADMARMGAKVGDVVLVDGRQRSTALRLTVEDRASAQNARMISARRCSMVMRRAYWVIRARVFIAVLLVMMTVGASRPRPVTISCRTVPG